MQQPLENLMRTTMDSIKKMIDVNTVVGDPVETKDGTVAIPISRVCYAFVAGGGDLTGKNDEVKEEVVEEDNEYPFAGGTGAGVSIQPVAFLTSSNGQLRMIPVTYNHTVDRIIDMIPNFIENIENMVKNRDNENAYN